jgi:hypothetical protein
MSRAFNLFSRYSQQQLRALRQKITGHPANRAPEGFETVFKRAPTRRLEDIALALDYHHLDNRLSGKHWDLYQ